MGRLSPGHSLEVTIETEPWPLTRDSSHAWLAFIWKQVKYVWDLAARCARWGCRGYRTAWIMRFAALLKEPAGIQIEISMLFHGKIKTLIAKSLSRGTIRCMGPATRNGAKSITSASRPTNLYLPKSKQSLTSKNALLKPSWHHMNGRKQAHVKKEPSPTCGNMPVPSARSCHK